jgi:hypothetical protein
MNDKCVSGPREAGFEWDVPVQCIQCLNGILLTANWLPLALASSYSDYPIIDAFA